MGHKFTRHEWAAKEVVTANQLNNIENGIEEALEAISGIPSGIVTESRLKTINNESIIGTGNLTIAEIGGAEKAEFDSLRDEVGPKPETVTSTVYARLATLEAAVEELQ
jgi:hypothetical protein